MFILVSYIEMFALAKQIAAAQTTVVPFVIAGVFYYIFNFVVAMSHGMAGKEAELLSLGGNALSMSLLEMNHIRKEFDGLQVI